MTAQARRRRRARDAGCAAVAAAVVASGADVVTEAKAGVGSNPDGVSVVDTTAAPTLSADARLSPVGDTTGGDVDGGDAAGGALASEVGADSEDFGSVAVAIRRAADRAHAHIVTRASRQRWTWNSSPCSSTSQ